MQDDTPERPPNGGPVDDSKNPISVKSVGSAALGHGKAAVELADKASTVAEGASHAFGAIKWTAIAIVTIIIAGGGYGIYKTISAPVKAVGNATEAVSQSVKTGADKLKDSSANVVKRLAIPIANPANFDRASEGAFTALSNMAVSEPDSVKDRLFRTKNFLGNEGRFCTFSQDFGNGELPVFIAADNAAHASAKALGGNANRMMRMIIEAGKDDVALSVVWDEVQSEWTLKWKATTLKKLLSDGIAAQRAFDVLKVAADKCK